MNSKTSQRAAGILSNGPMLTPEAVRKEVAQWELYLNEVVGVLSFTLGMAALGTGNPQLYGLISFAFVALFHVRNFQTKASILGLRSQPKLSELESHALYDFLTQLKFRRLLLSFFGYLFLALVATGGWMLEGEPELQLFFYGETQ